MSVRVFDPLTVARQLLYVREITGNHGQRVNGLQRWCGCNDGDPWCACFAGYVLDICYQGKSPLPRTGSCDVILALAQDKGWTTKTPVPGDLYLRVRDGNDAHHIGFVTQFAFGAGHFGSISGNTNDTGASDGDGVYEHDVIGMDGDVFVHIPENA